MKTATAEPVLTSDENFYIPGGRYFYWDVSHGTVRETDQMQDVERHSHWKGSESHLTYCSTTLQLSLGRNTFFKSIEEDSGGTRRDSNQPHFTLRPPGLEKF